MNRKSEPRGGSRLRVAFGLTGALALCACATTPPPTATLEEAHQAIAAAEQAEAGRYASVELSDARSKLASADAAVSEKNMIAAQRLAEESIVDAQLASAKTADVKAYAVNNEMKHSTGTLIEEMQRSSGATP
jgi:outer membrane PBP1 activator LpoA protein